MNILPYVSIIKQMDETPSNMLATLYVIDREKNCLNPSYASKEIQSATTNKIMNIDENFSILSNPIYEKERAFYEHIDTNPLWRNNFGLIKQANLKSCWIEPLYSQEEEVRALLFIYYKDASVLTPEDIDFIDELTN